MIERSDLPATALPSLARQPFLKWPGGKRWMISYFQPLVEAANAQGRRFVELFAGSAAVTLGTVPDRALLIDKNRSLMALYGWIQRGELECDPTVAAYQYEGEDAYQRNRDRYNELIEKNYWSDVEAAYLFYWLNRTGYNGLVRYSKKGRYNVPAGKYKRPIILSPAQLVKEYQPALQRIRLHVGGDFMLAWLRHQAITHEPGAILPDMVFADPPYDQGFSDYTPGGYSWRDQIRLVSYLSGFDGPVVITNADTGRIRSLYLQYGYTIEAASEPRSINSNGAGRQPAKTIIAHKNLEQLSG